MQPSFRRNLAPVVGALRFWAVLALCTPEQRQVRDGKYVSILARRRRVCFRTTLCVFAQRWSEVMFVLGSAYGRALLGPQRCLSCFYKWRRYLRRLLGVVASYPRSQPLCWPFYLRVQSRHMSAKSQDAQKKKAKNKSVGTSNSSGKEILTAVVEYFCLIPFRTPTATATTVPIPFLGLMYTDLRIHSSYGLISSLRSCQRAAPRVRSRSPHARRPTPCNKVPTLLRETR